MNRALKEGIQERRERRIHHETIMCLNLWMWLPSSIFMKLVKPEMWASLVAQQQRTCLQCRKRSFDPWVKKDLWRREWQPTAVFLPGESLGQRSLASSCPWGRKELDTME